MWFVIGHTFFANCWFPLNRTCSYCWEPPLWLCEIIDVTLNKMFNKGIAPCERIRLENYSHHFSTAMQECEHTKHMFRLKGKGTRKTTGTWGLSTLCLRQTGAMAVTFRSCDIKLWEARQLFWVGVTLTIRHRARSHYQLIIIKKKTLAYRTPWIYHAWPYVDFLDINI